MAALIACVALLWACSHADYTYGLPLNIVAGAIGGLAVAKLIVEAVRWSRNSRSSGSRDGNEWSGLLVAAVCMTGGMVVLGGIAWISIGMAEESRRVMEWRAAHPVREGGQ